jgi:hypothetical protein
MWSLNQKAIVAEVTSYIVFFDWDKGVAVNLLEVGGVYADLHNALVQRMKSGDEMAMKWDQARLQKSRAKI